MCAFKNSYIDMKHVRNFLLTGLIVFCLIAAVKVENGKYFEITKNIELFSTLYRELNSYYVDDIDPGKLMRTGIDAMVGSLDPFTNYISESDIEGYRFQTEGRYNGIGAQSKKIDNLITIVGLYEGKAADKAGLKVGDQILAVDGRDATGKDEEQFNEIIRGFPGSEVELSIKRPGSNKNLKIKLIREEVNVPNVPYFEELENGIGYIALTIFTHDAGRNVSAALRRLREDHPNLKGVILDLRGNGGGLLNEAVNVSNVFVPKGELVVTTKGKVKEWDRSFSTLNAPVDENIPLAILVDKNTASASEIVSGVVQDYDRGVLIGQMSYGKGLVQNTVDIGYNSKVKLTTAKYYIPSGRCIQSVEYQNGEPIHIADEKRTKFETRSGRTVLDGGGIKPDILLDPIDKNEVVKALVSQDYLFHYATEFCLKNPTIDSVIDFHFNDFDGFLKYLDAKDYDFDLESEEVLRKLEERLNSESLSAPQELKALHSSIKAAKRAALIKNKEAIVDLLEKEIVSRYYYEKGKIRMGLRNDAEVKEAIGLLKDPSKYQKILKGEG